MIVIGSNTSDNGKSRFTEDVSHFMELRQNRQIAKRSAKNWLYIESHFLSKWGIPRKRMKNEAKSYIA